MLVEDYYDKYNADFGCTPSQYHASIDKLWKALGVSGAQNEDCFTMAANEITRLRRRVEELDSCLDLLRETQDRLMVVDEIVKSMIYRIDGHGRK